MGERWNGRSNDERNPRRYHGDSAWGQSRYERGPSSTHSTSSQGSSTYGRRSQDGGVPAGNWRTIPKPVVLPSMRSSSSSGSSSHDASPAIVPYNLTPSEVDSIIQEKQEKKDGIGALVAAVTTKPADNNQPHTTRRSWADEDDDYVDFDKDPFAPEQPVVISANSSAASMTTAS